MGYRMLYIFVEGLYDVKFFEKIIQLGLLKKYDTVKLIPYSGDELKGKKKQEKIDNHLKVIKLLRAKGLADYIFVTDIDNSPCVTDKKEKIQPILKNVEKAKIIVVIKEIESWYLAGLNNTVVRKLKIPNFDNTDTSTKEQFESLIPKRFGSKLDFRLEILKNFSIETARQKNRSFRYFIEKYNCKTSENVGNGLQTL